MEIRMSYDVDMELDIKGSLENEKKIGKFRIMLGTTGITMDVDVILYGKANGEVGVKFGNDNITIFTYKNGKIKKTTTTSNETQEVKAAMDLEVGGGLKGKLKGLGITITDIKVKAGGQYEFETGIEEVVTEMESNSDTIIVTEGRWNIKSEGTFPVVSLGVGLNTESFFKPKLEWQLVGPKGLIKIKPITFKDDYVVLYIIEEVKAKHATISLKSFLEDITFAGQKWDDWTLQEVYDACGLNEENGYWVSGDITLSDGNGIWVDISSYGMGTMVDGVWIEDKEYVSYSTRPETGVCETALIFQKEDAEGTVKGIVSYIPVGDTIYTADAAELEWIEGYGKYALDNNCQKLADILISLGMTENNPELLAAIETGTTYETNYSTEYGEVEFELEEGYCACFRFTEYTSPYYSIVITGWDENNIEVLVTKR